MNSGRQAQTNMFPVASIGGPPGSGMMSMSGGTPAQSGSLGGSMAMPLQQQLQPAPSLSVSSSVTARHFSSASSFPKLTNVGSQKPEVWVQSLINRFEEQLPVKTGIQTITTRTTLEQQKEYLINISRCKFSLVIQGLTKMLQNVASTRIFGEEAERSQIESQLIILDTLEQCLVNGQPKDTPRVEEQKYVNLLLPEICQFLNIATDNPLLLQLKLSASKVLFALSLNNFNSIFSRISTRLAALAICPDECVDLGDVELIQHINVDRANLAKVLNEIIGKFKQLKKNVHISLIAYVEKAIWNFMDTYPEEFMSQQKVADEDLAEACEKMFDLLDYFTEGKSQRKVLAWPLQVMLLMLSPMALEEVVNADNGAPCSPKHLKKKQFLDHLRKSLVGHGTSKQLTEGAGVACVKLCKASTYISNRDSTNVVFMLVQTVINDLKGLIFNPNKPFSRGANYDVDLMIDCFVAFFHINPHNLDVLKVCLNLSASPVYHFVLVNALHRIATQPRLPFWPSIDILYNKVADLRVLFIDTLTCVCQGCGGVPPIRFAQNLSLKEKVSTQLKFREKTSEEVTSYKYLLVHIVRLMSTDPLLFLYNASKQNTEMLINGLVSVVHQNFIADLAEQAMEALLVLHQPCNIILWNMEAPLPMFWDTSSSVLFSISQKLIQHQIANYNEVLKWLREILKCRNAFLSRYKDNANTGSNIAIARQAQIKLEVVLFMYLWSIDIEAVLTAMSCFQHLCEEVEIRATDEFAVLTLLPNYQIYHELTQAAQALTTGRAQLQKRIMGLLRRIDKNTLGVAQAWDETHLCWDESRKFLSSFPKIGERPSKRRTSHSTSSSSPEHELDDVFSEWLNMTGFLCALGGVSVQKKSTPRPMSSVSLPSDSRKVSIISAQNSNQDLQYCPVTQFCRYMLSLLVCNNERFGPKIQKHVKELLGHELNPQLYPILFEQIRTIVEKFFDSNSGQVVISDLNTQFVEHIVFVIRNILTNKTDKPAEDVGATSIESMILGIVRYCRHLDSSQHSLHIKQKFCQLVETLMHRRDDLAFRQEMKFRNKLVEYLSDWVLGNSHQITAAAAAATAAANVTSAVVTSENREAVRELDCAAVKAIAALLTELPLQPEENDRGDIVDAKSQLFLKYFTLFMNLLNECGHAGDEKGKDDEVQTIDILRTATIQAMSNLLSANVESGLVHSISLGYHNDLQTRVAFLEVLTKILQQGTEFDTLAENIAADRFERLVELLTMIDDKGELPIANALANVAPSSQVDDVARVFVSIFEAKHLLYELLWNLFVKEVELADCMQTIFRGTTLASKVMACCFRMFGASYITSVVKPHVESMLNHPDQSYEIDPNRLDGDVNVLLAAHKKNLEIMTQRIFDSITSSLDRFPPQLRCLCTCLYNVIAQRFPPPSSINAVGTVIFLRFINPVIVSPVENGIMDMQPASNVKRGLMYVSKILQNVASHVLFSKEQHMRPLNDFLRANFDDCRRFFVHITADGPPPPDPHGTSTSYINDVNVLALHRLLYYNQEKNGEHLGSNRDHKAGRRPFDKLATLLAHLGPPEHKSMESQWSVHGDLSYNRFEEIMSKQHIHEKDEFKSIKSMNIFYQSGKSINGHPVFYYIARKYKMNEHHADMLIYHVLLALKPFQHQRFELVIDFTHTCAENRFRTEVLTKWSAVLPVQVYDNLSTIYIYNCSTWVKEYFKFHESFLSAMKGSRKLYFVESISRLNEFLESGARLPSTTNSLEEDLKVFHGALKLSHKDTKVSIKLGSSAIQITSAERTKVLGHPVLLNDVYYAGEIEEVILVDDNQFTLSLHEQGPLSFIHDNCDEIVQAIIHIRTRWELSQPDNVINVHSKIRPKAVPGTLLNISLLNLGSPDPSLRSAAYNLLCALTATFNLKIEGQLLETAGLCIPANNTIFIKSVSEKLAVQEPHLTLEFMEECIQGFKASTIEIKHLVLEYVPPWLGNLTRFCKHSDEQKRQKVALILDKLITLTLQEEEMYPSIIAKIWGNLGQVSDLLDMILDSFIKRSVTGGLGSTAAEILADTAVALASSNVDLVAKKIIQRLLKLIDKTCVSPTWTLEQHLMFEDIGILTRYLLMLSFNNQLDVVKNLPYLLHFVAMLLSTGPIALRASIHGLVINIIHSLLTCSTPVFTEATQKILRLALTEFSLPKFYSFFGITAVKSAAVTAFRFSHRPGERSLAPYAHLPSDHSRLSLSSLEAISDALLEITEACMEDIPSCDWLERWTSLARSFAIRYNPSLQPRALVVFGCISKQVTDQDVKQLLRILVKALESFSDVMLIDAIIMCLTRLEPILRAESPIHKALFWIAICILQLDEVSLYSSGLALLEQNLHTLDSQGVFEYQSIEEVLMSTREPLEWQYFKQLDHAVGMSFKNAFHFALVGHLVKGFRHPEPESINRTVRILSMLLTIVSKPLKRDRFEVTCESVPYLAALLPVSEEVRSRCRLKHMVMHNGGGMATMSESMDSIDGDSLAPGAFYDDKDGSVTGTIARRQKSMEVLSGAGRQEIQPPQNVYAVSPQGERSIALLASPTGLSLPPSGSTGGAETPKSWKSLDLEQMESVSGAGLLPSPSTTISVAAPTPGPSTGLLLSPSNSTTRPVFLRSQRSSSMPTHNAGLKSIHTTHSASADERNRTVRTSVSGDSSVLLDPEFLTDYPTQALTLSILATIVRHTTDENEARILYQYLAEASVVFPKVFPVIHSLLDAKINSVLQLCHDQAILEAVQSIIHNMITCEEAVSLQQPPQSLQSLGFGGLWRFAGPFNRASASADSAELFVNCLEAMVETCLPGDDGDEAEGEEYGLGTGTGSLNSSVAINLSNSLSSLSLGSPTDKEAGHDWDGAPVLPGAGRRGYAHLHGHAHTLGHHQRSSSCKRTVKAPATGKQHEL